STKVALLCSCRSRLRSMCGAVCRPAIAFPCRSPNPKLALMSYRGLPPLSSGPQTLQFRPMHRLKASLATPVPVAVFPQLVAQGAAACTHANTTPVSVSSPPRLDGNARPFRRPCMNLLRLPLILVASILAAAPVRAGDEQDCFQGREPAVRIKGCSELIQR